MDLKLIDEKLARFKAETRLWMVSIIVVSQLDIHLPKEAAVTALAAVVVKGVLLGRG